MTFSFWLASHAGTICRRSLSENALLRRHYLIGITGSSATLQHDGISFDKRQLSRRHYYASANINQSSRALIISCQTNVNNKWLRPWQQSAPRRYSTGNDLSKESSDPTAVAQTEIPACLYPYTGIPTHPDKIDLEPGQRLVALGDVHGDFQQMLNALLLAGLVEEHCDTKERGEGENDCGRSFVWTGGNAILVQIGDVLDRGPNELSCWHLLAELSRQAETVGGRVILLHGNHELWTSVGFFQLDQERYFENLDYDDGIDDHFETAFGQYLDEYFQKTEGDWRQARLLNDLVTSGVLLHPRKVAARWAAMEPGGLLSKDFLSTFKIAVQVGKTILVHAGMAPEHLDRFGGIAGMNEKTQEWILKKAPRVGRRSLFVPPNDPDGRLRTYISSMPDFFLEGDDNAYSPIWMRCYSDPPDDVPHNEEASQMLGTIITAVNVIFGRFRHHL